MTLQIQKFGHACLLVTTEAGNRVLIDPGTFSKGYEGLTELSAVLITHQHADHVDLERLRPLLAANPKAMLLADPATAGSLREQGFSAEPAEHAGRYDANGVAVEAIGTTHALIHADIPQVPNVGYLLDEQLFHPGDALTVPDRAIDVLALPVGAPWVKSGEVIDYLRAVAPRIAVPIHEGTLSRPQMEYTRYADLGPTGTDLTVIDDGVERRF